MTDTGLYEGSALQGVDPKGRVAIPADFRAVIERNSAARTVVIGFHPTLPCLRAYDMGWSHEEEARLNRLELGGADAEAVQNERESIFGEVERTGFDPSGRFVMPDFHKEEAGIDGEAFFQGAGRTFNIWSPERLMAEPSVSERTRRRCAHLLAKRDAKA